jgi:hypothetical protein
LNRSLLRLHYKGATASTDQANIQGTLRHMISFLKNKDLRYISLLGIVSNGCELQKWEAAGFLDFVGFPVIRNR